MIDQDRYSKRNHLAKEFVDVNLTEVYKFCEIISPFLQILLQDTEHFYYEK